MPVYDGERGFLLPVRSIPPLFWTARLPCPRRPLLPMRPSLLSQSSFFHDEISGSINWLRASYDHSCKAVPVIVHPAATMDAAPSPPSETRVIGTVQLAASGTPATR